MRVLITGITGMAGSFLAEYLVDHHPNVEVFGTFRWRSKLDNLQDLRRRGLLNVLDEGQRITDQVSLARVAQRDRVTVIDCELQDASAVRGIVRAVQPDRVFHLAAQSFVPTSWTAPAATLTNNIVSELNMFEAIREARLDPVIHIAGSSEEYGLVYPDEAPISESNPMRPLSPYAVSKVAQETLAIQYFRSYGMKCIVTRGFNHTGPRRGQVFATSSFAKQIAQIEAGLQDPVLQGGDLDSKRDWTDTRDMVRAYWLAAERGTPGEVYNVGRGTCMRVGEMLDILLSHTSAPISIEQDPSRMRPSDVRLLWANVDKFKKATNWEPTIPFEKTMADLLEYWRDRIRASTAGSLVASAR
ncbi:MAG: GDP-mannose 4,6-dehydratase [Chloroflexi bacterium]|nr:GDP-mannose 4,6-dehydratase [Chloroflexota bacterium]MBV9601910.1 GDP-mannose 4,6-dehydratase [Chloroflexota bacterium]